MTCEIATADLAVSYIHVSILRTTSLLYHVLASTRNGKPTAELTVVLVQQVRREETVRSPPRDDAKLDSSPC
jgi:hypothetical protein